MALEADEYTRKAEEAEAQAGQVTDYAAKQLYLEVASQWRVMAAEAVRNR